MGKFALHRSDQSITNLGDIFQDAAGVGDGRRPFVLVRGRAQPANHQAYQVSKLFPLLPQNRRRCFVPSSAQRTTTSVSLE